MFFKNIRIYKITEALNLDHEALERALAEHKFSPCTGQEAVRMGFTYPLHHSIKQYHHQQQHLHLFAVKRQEKMLPAAVINEELQPKIAALELDKGRPLGRKEKQALREDLIQTLLPRAMPRSSVVSAIYDSKTGYLILNTSSASRAEDLLSLLRKSLGSLPALPWTDNNKLNLNMQDWLAGKNLPSGFELGNSVELKAPDEEGAKAKFSNHLLTSAEVQSHLEDKLVAKLEMTLPNALTFTVNDDGSLRRIQWHEILTNKNDELGWDDLVARMNADAFISCAQMVSLINEINKNTGYQS